MTEISPLEIESRRILGLNRIIGDEPFGAAMLARAVSQVADADVEFQTRFLMALADAIAGRDFRCSIKVERTGRRGQPGNGGHMASSRAHEIACEVKERTERGETQDTILADIEDRLGLGRSQVRADLADGRKAIAHIAAFREREIKRRNPV